MTTYTDKQKYQAIKDAATIGRSASAKKNGVGRTSLNKWVARIIEGEQVFWNELQGARAHDELRECFHSPYKNPSNNRDDLKMTIINAVAIEEAKEVIRKQTEQDLLIILHEKIVPTISALCDEMIFTLQETSKIMEQNDNIRDHCKWMRTLNKSISDITEQFLLLNGMPNKIVRVICSDCRREFD